MFETTFACRSHASLSWCLPACEAAPPHRPLQPPAAAASFCESLHRQISQICSLEVRRLSLEAGRIPKCTDLCSICLATTISDTSASNLQNHCELRLHRCICLKRRGMTASLSLLGSQQLVHRAQQRLAAQRQVRLAQLVCSSSARPKPQRCCKAAAAAAAAAAGSPGEPPLVEADTIIEPDGTVTAQPQNAEDRKDLWRRAIKLPMYSVGWAPILVGCSSTACLACTSRACQSL